MMISSSSSASSSSSTSGTTLTSNKRLSGLISGLDTDTLVKQLTANIQSKIDRQNQSKQIAQWQQASYREVISALSDFNSKYLSSSTSSSSILSSDFFNSTSIGNTSSYLNVSGSASAAKNMQVKEIYQLASQASFSSTHKVSSQAIKTGAIYENYADSQVNGSYITINYGGKDYKLTVSSDLQLGDYGTDGNPLVNVQTIVDDLQKQIDSNSDLNGKLKIETTNSSTGIKLSTTDSTAIKIMDGSKNLLTGLGLTASDSTSQTSFTGTVKLDSLYTKASLSETLAGSTLTFNLDGLTKVISFDESAKDNYKTPESLASYLQTKLNSAYGSDKVKVEAKDGQLSFTTPNSTTSVLTISSSSKVGVLGATGALKVYAGSSNRINTKMTLGDLAKAGNQYLTTPLTPAIDGTYKIKINEKEFTFKSTDSINSIINTINNDADANVTISYSSTLDTFSVAAKSGGSSGKVDISDENGNLAQVLFGTKDTDYTVKDGKDAKLNVSFDGGNTFQTIIRSDNKFTLDDVNFELLATNTTQSNDDSVSTIKFTVNIETDALYKKISDFVTDYNKIITLAYGKVTESKKTDGETYAPLTDDQKKEMTEAQIDAWTAKAKKGILQNDDLLFNLTNNLRSAMTDQVESIKSALYEIGITTESSDYSKSNGQLKIDETKLKKALTENPDKVEALFTTSDGDDDNVTNSDGIAIRLQKVIKDYINTSSANPGILVQKAGLSTDTVDNSTIAKQISNFTKKIKELKTQLADKQEYYYNQFTKLEQYMSQMNTQLSYFMSSSDS